MPVDAGPLHLGGEVAQPGQRVRVVRPDGDESDGRVVARASNQGSVRRSVAQPAAMAQIAAIRTSPSWSRVRACNHASASGGPGRAAIAVRAASRTRGLRSRARAMSQVRVSAESASPATASTTARRTVSSGSRALARSHSGVPG